MSKIFASADQIARAVVAAAGITGADPCAVLAISEKRPVIRARFLAFAALEAAIAGVNVEALARGLNFPYRGNVAKQKIHPRPGWMSLGDLDEVIGAILAPEMEPEGESETRIEASPPATMASTGISPAPPPSRPSRRGGMTIPLGEPEPGRSALDRRRAGVTEADEFDPRSSAARAREARRAITLPRVPSLERNMP